MGKNSRRKSNRLPTRPPQFYFGWPWLTGSTALFVLGVLLISYGTAAMQYSRWDHAYNRTVQPVFHPWAILLGIAFIVMSYLKPKK